MLETLIDRFRKRDRLALSRLLSHAARGEHLSEIRSVMERSQQSALTVAVTGSGGVGKSTLVGRFIPFLREQGKSVAVLACDPQSPLSGGALLGDRFRMPSRPEDDGIFIRSLSAVGGEGAIARHLDLMIGLLSAFGFDVILIETVGAGQGETSVRSLVDVVVLLLQPETGDELQWEKAGLLEVADVVAIHKSDLPGAAELEAEVRRELGRPIPVVRVSAKTCDGLDALWQAVTAVKSSPRMQTPLLHLAQEKLAERFTDTRQDPNLQRLLDAYRSGALPPSRAADELLTLLVRAQR